MTLELKRLYMETTRISAVKTAGEISELLAQMGAQSVMTEYSERAVSSLYFRLEIKGRLVPFRLPVRAEPIAAIFASRRRRGSAKAADAEQAARVAWRICLRWLQAQAAFIETGMVETEEVFLPYLQLNTQETLYQRLQASGFKALPEPKEGGE